MYKIIMKSPGGVKHEFETGFETEQQAIDVCESMDYAFVDDNCFEWALDIEE